MQASSTASAVALDAAEAAVVRVAQVTDCHIVAGARDRLRDMNTRDSFEAVMHAIRSDHCGLDLLLATGDLSQDASAASYRYLAAQFNASGLPLLWLPGNHDDASLMREHLRGDSLFAARQAVIGNWLILLLDSTIAGEAGGRLAPAQIEFVDASLRDHAHRHALVCLHHQPLPCASEWIDRLGLREAQALIDVVGAHANVRAVLWGHVHQQAQQRRDGIEWMSTPSTCFQFKPGSKTFALDGLGPGYRLLDLHADGGITTAVHHIQDYQERQR